MWYSKWDEILLKPVKGKLFWPPEVTIILGIECLILIAFDLISGPAATSRTIYFLIALLSIAMGTQTTAARRLGIAVISTTVLTNNLANVVEDLTALFRKPRNMENTKPLTIDSILRASAVVIYCLGAVLGAFAEHRYPFAVTWVPICIVGAIIFTVLIRFRTCLANQNKKVYSPKFTKTPAKHGRLFKFCLVHVCPCQFSEAWII